MSKSTDSWMDRLVEKYSVPTEKVEKPKRILTEEQIKKWNSEDDDLQEEVMDEVEFELVHDKVMEDSEWPELKEE